MRIITGLLGLKAPQPCDCEALVLEQRHYSIRTETQNAHLGLHSTVLQNQFRLLQLFCTKCLPFFDLAYPPEGIDQRKTFLSYPSLDNCDIPSVEGTGHCANSNNVVFGSVVCSGSSTT